MIISAFIRSTRKNTPVNVRLRLVDGRGFQRFGTIPNLQVLPEIWDKKREQVKERCILPIGIDRAAINDTVHKTKRKIENEYRAVKNRLLLPANWIDSILDNVKQQVASQNAGSKNIIDIFDLYIADSKAAESRKRAVRVSGRILERFLAVNRIKSPDKIKAADLEDFVRNEHVYRCEYPDIYRNVKQNGERGKNTVIDKMKMLAAFFAWAEKYRYFAFNPFQHYRHGRQIYGEPVSLTRQELESMLTAELPNNLQLERDMFCLQCFCGCRIGDFVKLQKSNLQNGILQYIPEKTREADEQAQTVYVPLSAAALEIIERHENGADMRLFPFTRNIYGKSGYAVKIRKILEALGMTRIVMEINPVSREVEAKPLYEVVSTHTARRTFINLNYRATQDPALIAKMTGHNENSRAFARYRKIDIDILQEQIRKVF